MIVNYVAIPNNYVHKETIQDNHLLKELLKPKKVDEQKTTN